MSKNAFYVKYMSSFRRFYLHMNQILTYSTINPYFNFISYCYYVIINFHITFNAQKNVSYFENKVFYMPETAFLRNSSLCSQYMAVVLIFE